jgi:hypothetical protein
MAESVRPLREGFQRPAETLSPITDHPPVSPGTQAPLPSQMKLERPEIEEPLTVVEEARRDIVQNSEKWPITVNLLYKSIMNDKGESINSLTFREPKAADINRVGNPTRLLWDGEVIIEERKMTYIMGALSGVLPVLLEQMDTRDWNSCALRLRKFFLADLRGW